MHKSDNGNTGRTVISLDAMGGDHAPDEIVMGAAMVASPGIQVTLTGHQDEIERCLEGVDGGARQYINIVNATEVIGFDEEPVKAVRNKADSSLVAACMEVEQGRADGVVSAGNTGAMMAASMFKLKRIKGLLRPGLCAILPTPGKPTVFIDVGANAEVRPLHLLEFSHLASIFAEEVLGVERPSVGLLSIGEEAIKGNDLVLDAHSLLRESSHLNFFGNVEGHDIVNNVVDVIVTDGFTGNVCLKLMEGTSAVVVNSIKELALGSITGKIGGLFLKRHLKSFKDSIDPEVYSGAYLLGVRGLAVVCHGNSNRRAIANALKFTARAAEHSLVEKIEKRFADLSPKEALKD